MIYLKKRRLVPLFKKIFKLRENVKKKKKY